MRFGRDKLLEPYRGMPVLHHAILRAAEVCEDIVVVLAPGQLEPDTPPGVSVRFARDPAQGAGPLAGVLAGLEVVVGALAVVIGGDMPDLSSEVLASMVRLAQRSGADAVALGEAGRFRPLPSVLRTERAARVASGLFEQGERRLRALLEALTVSVIDEPAWRAADPTARTLFDVDEPGDLER